MTSTNASHTVRTVAAYLDEAQRTARPVAQLSDGLSLDEAYAVQRALVDLRVGRGERRIGLKLGFTSEAKMRQMGVSEIIVGELTDAMQVAAGGAADLSSYIHPRIEPEVAFLVSREYDPADADTPLEEHIEAIAPALEIIDSRYRDFRFSLEDVVADNTSAAGFVVGDWTALHRVDDLPSRRVELHVDGRVVETGSTADILGHPVEALRQLSALLARHRLALNAGDLVLAGAATAAAPFGSGRVDGVVEGLSTVTVVGA